MTTTIETTDPEPDILEPDAPGTEPDWTTNEPGGRAFTGGRAFIEAVVCETLELMKAQRTELEDIDDYTADIFDRDVPLRDRVAHLVAEHAQMRAAAFADAYDELTGLVSQPHHDIPPDEYAAGVINRMLGWLAAQVAVFGDGADVYRDREWAARLRIQGR